MPWPSEVVIDANVMAHACNHDSPYFESAVEIVIRLNDSDCGIALDDSGKSAPDKSTSLLYNEYVSCMNPQQLPMIVIAALLSAGRVEFYPRLKAVSQEWKTCCRIVPRNKHDRVVLGIAVKSPEHLLVSNDYADFDDSTRDAALDRLQVSILDSDEFAAGL